MDDPIIEKVRKRQQELKRQNEANNHEMAELASFMRKYEELREKGMLNAPSRNDLTHSGVGERILANAVQILSDGEPKRLRHLFEELRKRGVEVGGKNETNKLLNLSGLLSRDERFKSEGKAVGWKLKVAKRPTKSEGQ